MLGGTLLKNIHIYIFTYFNIHSNNNQAHIYVTECFSDKLASLNVVTPLTTLSALGSNHHYWSTFYNQNTIHKSTLFFATSEVGHLYE